eukprot:comp21611_c0_seq1/m.30298 comp21611_c0_seq1/g.30298  ORF comp21611_c0_seq1/g.30298 comp21611_c0_seq1/m.30298 type:complete len:336 (-) comp21611_c0_seq1:185-1192(-)
MATAAKKAAPATGAEKLEPEVLDSRKIKDVLQSLTPILLALQRLLDIVLPLAERGVAFVEQNWHHVAQYKPELLIPALVGLVMMFFGGSYMTLIAAVEAFRMTGWEKTKEAGTLLYQNYREAASASKKDDELDENQDGVADVKQITRNELFKRKVALVLKTVNPQQVQEASLILYLSFMAVVATLKVRFAEAVTLGASLGQMLERAVTPLLAPTLRNLMPQEYHKWVPVLLSTASKAVGVSLAWWLFRVVNTFYSSVRGAVLLVKGLLVYAEQTKIIDGPAGEASLLFNLMALLCALSGAWWQIKHNFGVPFPLNILLLPFTVVEHALIIAINWF